MSSNSVFHTNIESLTLKNNKFREVLHTNTKQQLVIMSVQPMDDIPLEIHNDIDQFIRIEKGIGKAIIGEKQDRVYDLTDGSVIMIPAGTWHRICNVSATEPLKLYSVYSPPEHPKDRIDVTKPLDDSESLGDYHSFIKSSAFRRLHKLN